MYCMGSENWPFQLLLGMDVCNQSPYCPSIVYITFLFFFSFLFFSGLGEGYTLNRKGFGLPVPGLAHEISLRAMIVFLHSLHTVGA